MYQARKTSPERCRHERVQLTLKNVAPCPARRHFLQQATFDRFVQEYHFERPHPAIGMTFPAALSSASPRPYQSLPEPEYAFHDRTDIITARGRIFASANARSISAKLPPAPRWASAKSPT